MGKQDPNLDPLYIIRAIENLVDKNVLVLMTKNLATYPDLFSVRCAVGPEVEVGLRKLSSGTLARIIEYGDLLIPVGDPPLTRRTTLMCAFDVTFTHWVQHAGMINVSPFAILGTGRYVLHLTALLTVITIIWDMMRANYYQVPLN